MNLATPMATKVVGALALLVVAALGWTLVVGPETATLSDTRAQVETTRDQNSVLTLQLAQLEKQQQQLGETRQMARALAVKFPPTADQPGLFEEVTKAAVAAGIGPKGITTLAPTPPTLGGTGAAGTPPTPGATPAAGGAGTPTASPLLARQTVTVSVTGTYDQTQRLLENLEHMPRAYLLSTITLAGDPETGDYTTTIAGDMFVMAPVDDPGETLKVSGTTQE